MAKKLKHPRCIHMPGADNTVVIFSSKNGKTFDAGFTIASQDFVVANRDTKAEAEWYCNILEIAFQKLITPAALSKVKSEEGKKMIKDSLIPKINIVNLK